MDETLGDRHNGFKVSRQGPRKSQASAIPDVHTYHATEASVTLEGIDNVEDFVERLDRIEPPGQMISFLADPLLQKYVELKPSPITSTRIDLWLATCLEDLYEAQRMGTVDPQYLKEILNGLLKLTEYTKEAHPIALSFLQTFLPIWNGQDHVDAILELLAYTPTDTFQTAYITYFQPAEQALASQGPSNYVKLIDFYTSLLQQQVRAANSRAEQRSPSKHQIFHDLTSHVSTLSISLLLSLPPESGHVLTSSILSFYELLSTCSKPHIVPIVLPPMHLVYLLTQHASPTTFSRTCGIIGAYKSAFDQHPRPVKDYYPTHVTEALNWCLRDVYHLLWIARALVMVDQKALGLYCDPALRSTLNDYLSSVDREYAIGSAFGLSNHTWLASLSAAAWRALEEREISREGYDKSSIQYHQGPVSQRSLEVLKRKGGVGVDWDGSNGYKVFVLHWLAERGLGGIKDLMFATVTELKGKA